MKRQFAVFLIVSITLAVWGVSYASNVVADFSILYPTTIDTAKTKFVLQPRNFTLHPPQAVYLNIKDKLSKRLEQFDPAGNYGVTVHNEHVEVLLPSSQQNMPYLINVIPRVGHVAFIDGGNERPPLGNFVETGPNSGAYPILFTGQDIAAIVPPATDTGEIFYQFKLTPAATERVNNFIHNNTDAYTCLVIDKQVINCSKMYHLADNTLDILPKLESNVGLQLADLALFLKSGPLPFPLEVVE